MVSTSTTTLIQAVNRVLLDVGERQVTSLTSTPASQKATAYLQDAFTHIQNSHNWDWQNIVTTATEWVTRTAKLGNVQRILNCYWDTGTGYRIVRNLSEDDVLRRNPIAFTSTDATQPNYWAVASLVGTDYKTVLVHPYPSDSAGQAKVLFAVVTYYDAPTTATQVFSLPERFMPLLIHRARAFMLAYHLEDMQGYQAAMTDYERELRAYRAREDKAPPTTTMFRRPSTHPIRTTA